MKKAPNGNIYYEIVFRSFLVLRSVSTPISRNTASITKLTWNCVCVRACCEIQCFSFIFVLTIAAVTVCPGGRRSCRAIKLPCSLWRLKKDTDSRTGQPFNLQIYWGSVSQEIVHLFRFDLGLGFMETVFRETTFWYTPEASPLCATVSYLCVMHCAFCLTRTVTSRCFTDLECPHVFMQTSFHLDFYLCKSFAEKDVKTFMKGIWNTVKCEIKVMYMSKLCLDVMKLGLSHWRRNVVWGCWGRY